MMGRHLHRSNAPVSIVAWQEKAAAKKRKGGDDSPPFVVTNSPD